MAYILLISVILSGFLIIVPFVLTQLGELLNNILAQVSFRQTQLQTRTIPDIIQYSSTIPTYIKDLLLHALEDPEFVRTLQNTLQQNIAQILSLGTKYVSNLGNIAVLIVSEFFSIISKIAIVMTLAVLFSIEKNSVMDFIANVWGNSHHEFVYKKLEKMYTKL